MKTIRALAAALLCSGTAHATETPPTAAPSVAWSDITEVVVLGHAPGPAMWKLTRGEATVWVMGWLETEPKDFRWNTARLKRLLGESRELILPIKPTGRFMALMSAFNGHKLPSGQTLADVLTPDSWQRFKAVTEREQLSLSRYERYKPASGAPLLLVDARKKHNIETSRAESTLQGLVRDTKVKTRAADTYNVRPLLSHFKSMDAVIGEQCLNFIIDQIDYDLATTQAIADAWAVGDLGTVLQLYREPPSLGCVLSGEQTRELYQSHAVEAVAQVLDQALNRSGTTVAIVPLRDLLRVGGVLDLLRDKAEISSPAEPEAAGDSHE